ncbi:MAG TPA: hypothetical protein GXX40_08350 [Firmicutes bacterium]|nr:hypothetical protein [Bacillota bacterium]
MGLDDVEASLRHLKLPPVHRKFVRTNLIDRSFEEERRRTKVISRFFDEKSCLKLVFATHGRQARGGQRVRFRGQEQIRRLRIALGRDGPDAYHDVASSDSNAAMALDSTSFYSSIKT